MTGCVVVLILVILGVCLMVVCACCDGVVCWLCCWVFGLVRCIGLVVIRFLWLFE